jgi:uncharacterized membrane protein YiaA
MGGRLPDRPTAVALFAVGALVALGFAGLALFERPGPRLAAWLLVAQAGLALAFSTGSDPLMTLACTWLWLLLVPLAGLASARVATGSAAGGLTMLNLAMIPGSVAFIGLWLGGLALNARGLLFAMIPVLLAVGLAAIATLSRMVPLRSVRLEIAAGWGGVLLLIAAFPVVVMDHLVVPAAATVRLVPRGTVATSLFGLVAGGGTWPAFVVSLAVVLGLGIAVWGLRLKAPSLPSPASGGGKRLRAWFGKRVRAGLPSVPEWSRFLLWGAFGIAVFNVLTRS